MTKTTIGVTGAGGYVGNVLCRYLLQKGYGVKAMDNFHKGHCDALIPLVQHKNFSFQYGDVSLKKDVEKFMKDLDGVIHLAAIVGFPACSAQPLLSDIVNVKGTSNILSCRKWEVPLVFASTGSVYGKVEGICTEDSPKNPLSEYGKDKLRAENMVMAEPNTTSLRFATGFGVSPCMRVNLLVNDLCYQAITNKVLTIFQGNARRTFIHVYDMARSFTMALEGLLNQTNNHFIYNVGANELNCTKLELANMIKERTGCTVLTNDYAQDADQRDYAVDYSRFENDFGFKPRFTLEEGINDLLKTVPLLRVGNRYA